MSEGEIVPTKLSRTKAPTQSSREESESDASSLMVNAPSLERFRGRPNEFRRRRIQAEVGSRAHTEQQNEARGFVSLFPDLFKISPA